VGAPDRPPGRLRRPIDAGAAGSAQALGLELVAGAEWVLVPVPEEPPMFGHFAGSGFVVESDGAVVEGAVVDGLSVDGVVDV